LRNRDGEGGQSTIAGILAMLMLAANYFYLGIELSILKDGPSQRTCPLGRKPMPLGK